MPQGSQSGGNRQGLGYTCCIPCSLLPRARIPSMAPADPSNFPDPGYPAIPAAPGGNNPSIRQEIATCAARMIAEDGLDYAGAKQKAARQVLGTNRVRGDFLPDNDEITEEVRIYQQLFQSDTQPARLTALRHTALALMRLLDEYQPVLVGAVCNGTAGEHTDIHLNLYTSNAKDVEIFLLNEGIDFEASESLRPGHQKGREPVETLSFLWSPGSRRRDLAEGVRLHIHPERAQRLPVCERATVNDLEKMLAEEETAP